MSELVKNNKVIEVDKTFMVMGGRGDEEVVVGEAVGLLEED